MRTYVVVMVILLSLCFSSAIAQSSQDSTTPVTIPRFDQGANIDGILNDVQWENAAVFTLDWETEPGINLPAPVKTTVYMFYTKTHVYVAYRAQDPKPEEIRARFWERDKQVGDDEVWMEFDTFNDGLTSYVFQSNAVGAQTDYVFTGSDYDSSWDSIFAVRTNIDESGYTVEFEIPFSSLVFQPSDSEQVWGVMFGRSYPREVNHQLWNMPNDKDTECHVCQFRKVIGFKGVKPGNNLEITPTVNAVTTSQYDMPTDAFETVNDELDAGVNAKWGITNNMIAGLTINPDFSQVEADALQLDINSPFALSYEEKRPFFTEGSSFFQTHLNAVYTRSIRDPEWGLKLQGKEGKNAFGLLIVEDAVTNIVFPGSQRSVGTSLPESSTVAIGRFTRDILKNSNISVMMTNRESDSYYNRVYGIDTNWQISRSDRVLIQYLGSTTKYSDEVATVFGQPLGEFSSDALDVYYWHDTRNFDFIAHYMNIGENFRADSGFIPQVGYRKAAVATRNTWFDSDDSWWDIFEIETVARDYRDKEGNLLSRQVAVSLNVLGAMQSYMRLQGQIGRQSYLGQEYNQNYLRFIGQCVPHSDVRAFLYAEIGDEVDYSNARGGDRILLDGNIRYAPSKHVSLHYYHTYERMKAENKHLYTANVAQLITRIHFSERLMLRLVGQFVDYQYSTENYLFVVDPEYRQISTQLLLSYKVNPRTLVFVGYSDNYLGNSVIDVRKDEYTYFAKVSYALRF